MRLLLGLVGNLEILFEMAATVTFGLRISCFGIVFMPKAVLWHQFEARNYSWLWDCKAGSSSQPYEQSRRHFRIDPVLCSQQQSRCACL